jgi:menaquinone-dependent protoporphyrinogen oxidase
MSRILIVYGTTDGHTRKIAAVLASTLEEAGCDADIWHAQDRAPDVDPAAYAGVIVAASVHRGAYQKAMGEWARRHGSVLSVKPSAFISVCLAVRETRPDAQAECQETVTKFLTAAGWRPATYRIVAGAVPFTRYGWLKRWMMKRHQAKVGGDTDTSRDWEYTDWDELRAFARDFAIEQGIVPMPAPTSP